MSSPHFADTANDGGSAIVDTLIVFALLGAIAVFVIYVLPRQDGGSQAPAEHNTFPD